MNKKFSTLMASLLLAGGLFSNAEAVTIKDAAATGQYYRMFRVAQYTTTAGWDTNGLLADGVKYYLSQTADKAYMSAALADEASMWKVTASKVDGVTVYTFANKLGKTLKYTDGVASQDKFYACQDADNNFVTDVEGHDIVALSLDASSLNQIQMAYDNTKSEYPVTFAATSTSEGSVNGNYTLAFDFEEVSGETYDAATLNAYLGSTAGFRIQIGDLKIAGNDNTFAAYTNLQGGEVFSGILKASTAAVDATVMPALSEGYYLTNGDKYVVLLTEQWSDFNTNHANAGLGYKFALMSKDALITQLKRDAVGGADNANPKILATSFTVSKNVNTGDYIEVVANTTTEGKLELYVANFNNVNYLTVNNSTTDKKAEYNTSSAKTYVKLGAGNVADPKTWLKKDSYYTVVEKETGKVLGLDGCNKVVGFYAASEVQADMPEGMWAVTYTGAGNYTFTNREAKEVAGAAFVQDPSELYVVDAAQNLYEWGGIQYIITAHAIKDLKTGYADLDVVNTKYVAGVYSPIHKGSAWFVENHSATSHQIGLDTDEDNATVWTLVKNAKAGVVDPVTDVKSSTDSLYVIHKDELSYWDASANAWKHGTDTLKAVSYKFVNEYNEALGYNTTSNAYAAKETAKNFVLKKVGDYYNMVEVTLPTVASNGYASFETSKVYGGDSAEKGLLARTCMYDRTENDIIEVKPVAAAMYRKVVNNLDTISIFRQENDKQMLFEDGKFLGLKNATQFDFAPAMLADTAYVRYNTYRPQYMLVLNPEITPAGKWCEEHQSSTCAPAVDTKGWIEGRYLVNLKDTAIAYNDANKHPQTNPYINTEKYYRLGFVQAKHIEDSLIIASTNDTLIVGTPDYNAAKFAFRYVDQEAGSFVIETANFGKIGDPNEGVQTENYGYIKWMNGVVVVVDDIENADVFNMNENEEGNPTANETIATSSVVVAGVNGAVVVKGAEGKNVIVSTILGKVVANEVVSSDNATIAAPAGVVVVSVDGESFKVVVK